MFLSADPGIANFGIAIVDDSKDFTVIQTHLVNNIRKFTPEEKLLEIAHGHRVVKIFSIIAKLNELLDLYPEIDRIVVEAPFYSALTPVAFSSLIEVITVVRYNVAIKRNLQFKLIEPLLVKKLFTNKGMASKEVMRQFLELKKQDGSVNINSSIESLSEHEIDAIAVGFSAYVQAINQPVLTT